MKHCKKRRVPQRKINTNIPQTTKRTVSKHKNTQNKTCENYDPMRLKLSYTSKYVTTREIVHLLYAIVVTTPVFQLDTF